MEHIPRTAVQTTYVDDQLPAEVEVTYPPHPCLGQRLPVLGRRRKQREMSWHVALPDGSRTYLPAEWTAMPGLARAAKRRSGAKRATPRSLRTLLAVLRSLVPDAGLLEAADQTTASKGGAHGDATGPVQEAGARVDGESLELASAGNTRGNRGPAGANGNGEGAGIETAEDIKTEGGAA